MSAPEVTESRFNLQAPEYCPKATPSRFAFLESSSSKSGRQRSGSCSSRRRSQSLSLQLEARRPVLRVKISNFSPDFDKAGFVEMMNSQFSDIRSIDFQPRYNERGRLFGFITFESEIGYNDILLMKSLAFGPDVLTIEPGQDKGSMPTSTTLVLSNVPVNTSEEDFKQWIERQSVQPLSFTYHRTDGFRGLVFVQYMNIEDAGIACGCLKDSILSGVPIKAEYKKKTDRREFDRTNSPVFLSSTAQQIWNQITTFKSKFVERNSGTVPSLVFPHDLAPYEKSIVFTYAEKLGLCHYTQEVGDTKMIMLSNTPPGATTRKSRSGSVETKELSQSLRKPRSGSVEMSQRRPRRMSCPTLESAPFVQKNGKENDKEMKNGKVNEVMYNKGVNCGSETSNKEVKKGDKGTH